MPHERQTYDPRRRKEKEKRRSVTDCQVCRFSLPLPKVLWSLRHT